MSDYVQIEKRLREMARVEIAAAALKRLAGLPDAEDDAAIHDVRVRDYTEAAEALASLTRELEEAKAKRIEANNQWRLDYNEMAGNAELLQEQVIEAVEPFAEFQRVAKTQAQSKRGDFWLALHSDKGHLAKITYDDMERLLALGARLSSVVRGEDDAQP